MKYLNEYASWAIPIVLTSFLICCYVAFSLNHKARVQKQSYEKAKKQIDSLHSFYDASSEALNKLVLEEFKDALNKGYQPEF